MPSQNYRQKSNQRSPGNKAQIQQAQWHQQTDKGLNVRKTLMVSIAVLAIVLWINYLDTCMKLSQLRKDVALYQQSHPLAFTQIQPKSQQKWQGSQQMAPQSQQDINYHRREVNRNELKPVYHPMQLPLIDSPKPTHIPHEWHRDKIIKFRYPVLGIPEPGKTFNFTVVEKKYYKQFDQEILDLFEPFNDTDCEYGQFGNQKQNPVLCNNFLKYSQALINLGAEDDNFSCHLTTQFKMPNYQYDCKGTEQTQCPSNKNMDINIKACTGQQSQNLQSYTFYSLSDIIKIHGLVRRHSVLKLDIKGREYSTLRYFPLKQLTYFDQIVAKWHFSSYPFEYWGNLDIFRTLVREFVPVFFQQRHDSCFPSEIRGYRKLNSGSAEVTLVNRRLLTQKSDSRSFLTKSKRKGSRC